MATHCLSSKRFVSTSIVVSCKMGRVSHTKQILSNCPDKVTIVRPHHPLRGRRYDVLQSGKQRLRLRIDGDTSMYIPRAWTDADGPITPRREEILTIEVLRRLIALVEAYLKR